MLRNIEIALLALLLVSPLVFATNYNAHVSAAAVTGLGVGSLTTIYLNVTSGTGNILITGPTNISSDTVQSVHQAVIDAALYTKLNQSRYNFTYFINYSSVSGPSGGLALTLLTISGLTNVQLQNNFGVTGTVSSNSTVGEIGGIYEKVSSVKLAGKSFMIVPFAPAGSFEYNMYYIAQQTFGIPLVMVSNVSQAVPYAFGQARPKPIAYNSSQNLYTSALTAMDLSCSICNTSSFATLAYSTINLTFAEIKNITGNYSALQKVAESELTNYTAIAGKGYLYTGADLSFLQFSNAFLFANSKQLTNKNYATQVINDVASYCNDTAPPLMTSSNYEYIIGGEVRQTWAMITLNESATQLSNAQTTDDVAQSLTLSGNAYAWCFAARNMYMSAASSDVGFVNMSSSLAQTAYSHMATSQLYPGLYSQAAQYDYKHGMYGASLYNSEYATVFGNDTIYSTGKMLNATNFNIESSQSLGIWPLEFSAQASFYLKEAALQHNQSVSNSDISSAFIISELADDLANADLLISSSFVPSGIGPAQGSNSPNSTQGYPLEAITINSMQQQISQIYQLLFVIAVLVFVIFIIMIILLLRGHSQTQMSQQVQTRVVKKQPIKRVPRRSRRAGRR
ncbi:MAG: S16 family serine protease [Candidatus Micrarchaeales archaeon]